jgi:ABC-type polysaccharide/polyol phosphate export permease
VYFRDMGNILQLALFVGLYVSPVFYRPEAAPHLLQMVMLVNPITYLILCFQDAAYYGTIAHPIAWLVAFGFSLASFLVGARVFNVLQRYFGSFL